MAQKQFKPAVPVKTSTYVEAAVSLVPSALKVATTPVELAVNLYQTSYVVVAVAPPQPPVGAALVALNNVPAVVEQIVDGAVRDTAFAHASLGGAAANSFVLISRKITMLPSIFQTNVWMRGTGIFIILGSLGYLGFWVLISH